MSEVVTHWERDGVRAKRDVNIFIKSYNVELVFDALVVIKEIHVYRTFEALLSLVYLTSHAYYLRNKGVLRVRHSLI